MNSIKFCTCNGNIFSKANDEGINRRMESSEVPRKNANFSLDIILMWYGKWSYWTTSSQTVSRDMDSKETNGQMFTTLISLLVVWLLRNSFISWTN